LTPGIKMLLVQADAPDWGYGVDPFECLHSKKCIISKSGGKNKIKIEGLITSGEYKLVIFD